MKHAFRGQSTRKMWDALSSAAFAPPGARGRADPEPAGHAHLQSPHYRDTMNFTAMRKDRAGAADMRRWSKQAAGRNPYGGHNVKARANRAPVPDKAVAGRGHGVPAPIA